jgi:ERCC4-type nuclease
MLVLLDSNQNTMQPHFRQQLSDALQVSVQVTPLGASSGDVFVQLDNGDTCIFEIKETPNDLCASIADGRLFEQCQVIPTVARFPFLILHGELKYQDDFVMALRRTGWERTGWRRESVEQALLRCQALGMLVVQTPTLADKIRRLIEWCQKADNAPSARKRILKSPFETLEQMEKRRKIEFLAQLEGVGTERATNLVNAYPNRTLYELLTLAAIPDGSKIPLWGQGTYETVQKFLGIQMELPQ